MQVNKCEVSLLKTVSERAELEEGEEVVRKALREVFRSQRIGTKELAADLQLPIPVTAALRRELENEGLIVRDGGAYLTKKGEKFVKQELGLVYRQRFVCTNCQGRTVLSTAALSPLLEKLRNHLSRRPKSLPWLDQAHGTPETALLRAVYMLEKGDVEGRKVLFLGDDDFTSIAVGLLKAAWEVTVIDVDSRLLEAIESISKQEDLNITCLEADLRTPFAENLHQKYDVVFTDPPYTVSGLTLFLSRGITTIKPRIGAGIYLAFAHQPPKKMLTLQRIVNAMGLTIVEQLPRFNTYEGAEMFANTSFLTRLETTKRTKPVITEAFDGKLYTGEITQTVRIYKCRCGEEVKVGASEKFRTVEQLKDKGCLKCGKTEGFKLIKRRRLKDALAESLTIRTFRWADLHDVIEFEREISRKSFPEAPILDKEYHKQKLERAIEKESNGLKVALLDDEVVGWLWLRTEKDRNTNERFGYIKSIIVKPDHRHQGFGKKLVEVAEAYFLSKKIDRVDLIVSAYNHDADLFFEEADFERQHSTMRKRLKNEGKHC